MKRRLGRSGIFVAVDGKYCLSEERLKQMKKLSHREGTAWISRKRIMTLRIIRMATAVLIVTLLLVNIFVQSWEIRLISTLIIIAC
jgi:hypothetical protein